MQGSSRGRGFVQKAIAGHDAAALESKAAFQGRWEILEGRERHHFSTLFYFNTTGEGYVLTLRNNTLPMLQVSPHLCMKHDYLCQWLTYDLWQWAGSRYLQYCCYVVLYHSSSSAPQSYLPILNLSDHFSSSCIQSKQLVLCWARHLLAGPHGHQNMPGRPPIVIQTRRPLYIKESMIHIA